MYTNKDRLSRVLGGQEADRAPVVCTGGMMNAAVSQIMAESGISFPQAHTDPALMGSLAALVAGRTGFENAGLPFCMTIEAEALGSEIDLGDDAVEAKIRKEAYASVPEMSRPDKDLILENQRALAVIESVRHLHETAPDTPVIVTVTGAVSTGASVVEPVPFLKALRKTPEEASEAVDYITHQLESWVASLARAGADAVCIAEPTGTGEILGPAMFTKYVIPSLNRLCSAANREGTPAIVHICGDLASVAHLLGGIKAQAISVDAVVSLSGLRERYPDAVLMGNLSTYLLQNGSPDQIRRTTALLRKQGVNILAPACGLGLSTPVSNIVSFTEAAKA